MSSQITRRRFLAQFGMASIALPVIGAPGLGLASVPANKNIKFGYSAITWGGDDLKAIEDISSLGFRGIQLRSNTFPVYGQKPAELKKLLDQAKLELAMFSSGSANINTGNDEEQVSTHMAHAKFVRELGGKFIQVTNSSRPKTGSPSNEDLVKYGRLLTEIGKRTKPLGIQVAYHNHMGQLGQTPEEVDVILHNTDPAFVNFLLDVGHYQQGGGDPAMAIGKYKDRLKALHLKDVRNKTAEEKSQGYTWVELGQGRVNFPAVFQALDAARFKGYAIIELDSVPEKSKTPLECARTSKLYLKNELKFDI